ncbi:hypothetical protein ACMFMF_003805 [Clarireedia jacksonii]
MNVTSAEHFTSLKSTMSRAITIRRLFAAPPHLRISIFPQTITSQISRPYAVQSIAQPSFWKSLVPKPLRKSAPTVSRKSKTKDWNPATFFIWIFLLIGSMSIQMIALRNGFAAFERRADAKIRLLKEVIERIQNGEKVDVKGLLGTGDKKQEEEWEQGMFFHSCCVSDQI